MDDEPPEVQQYKTCAKCRIIERTKKKLRKPLAEETMRYGMRQFHEQNQSTDFMGDDMFSNDPYAFDADLTPGDSDVYSPQQSYNPQIPVHSRAPDVASPYGVTPNASGNNSGGGSDYGYSYKTSSLYPGPPSTSVSSAIRSSISGRVGGYSSVGAVDGSGSYQNQTPPSPLVTNPAHVPVASNQPLNGASNMHYFKSRVDTAGRPKLVLLRLAKDTYKRFLQIQPPDRSQRVPVSQCEVCGTMVNPDDSLSVIYRLCTACFTDPYVKLHVHKDYSKFLRELVHDKEYVLSVYVAELPEQEVESLFISRSVNSEEQFRKLLMEFFGLIYLEPVLGLLASLKFSRVSHNVGEVNKSQPVILQYSQQLHYRFTLPLRMVYGASTDTEKTRVEMAFVPETNLIIIKKRTQAVAPIYTSSFLRQLDDQWKSTGLGFSASPLEVYSAISISINREQFTRDFSGIVSQIKALRFADKSSPGVVPSSIVNYTQLASAKSVQNVQSDEENGKYDDDDGDYIEGAE